MRELFLFLIYLAEISDNRVFQFYRGNVSLIMRLANKVNKSDRFRLIISMPNVQSTIEKNDAVVSVYTGVQ